MRKKGWDERIKEKKREGEGRRLIDKKEQERRGEEDRRKYREGKK